LQRRTERSMTTFLVRFVADQKWRSLTSSSSEPKREVQQVQL
jgi:hypothetical protein